jgi:CheY-like chemotaxis protein
MANSRPLSLLIVEDETMIRMLMSEMLEELGYKVAGQAARVDEALALINSGLAFDVAILDVNLDGQTAEPVADAVDKRGLPFVFATGYGASGIPERFRGRPFLQKPFAIEQLSDALKPVGG